MTIFPQKSIFSPTNDKFGFATNDKTLLSVVSIHCETNTTTTFLHNLGANTSLSRKLSMAPSTTICLGCNQSFRRISLHWNQKPVCCSSHQQRSAAACYPDASHGRRFHDFGSDGSSFSETGSSGSGSCPSRTNLDENGLLGAIIFSRRSDADAPHGSSTSSSTAAKGTILRETILADGSVANTRVSARNLKNRASKRQRTGPHFPLAEDDECKSMGEDGVDDDDDFSSLSTLQSEMFPNACPGDDGDELDEGEEEEVQETHSYAAAVLGHQDEPTPDGASLSSGVPPGLGAVVHDPLEEALERLPTLLHYESALLELDSILRKPRTRTSFDLVVAWLEAALLNNTFKDMPKLARRKSLMKRLSSKFRTPPHELKTVALETGTEEGGVDDFQRGKTVKVPVWDFETVTKSFLLDPILFGNPDNLVNTDAPFEKFIVDKPTDSKEYLAGRHYSESYDLCIDDVDGPPRQFFSIGDIFGQVREDGRNNLLMWGTPPDDHSTTQEFREGGPIILVSVGVHTRS